MGCANSSGGVRTTVWRCQYCGLRFETYQQTDQHEKYQCPQRPGGGGGQQVAAYAQQPGGHRPGMAPGQQQQPPAQIRCGGCGQVFGVPPGHAQVRCPSCNVVNAVPVQQKPQDNIPQNVYNQAVGQHQAQSVGQPGPAPTGRKKALLIGVNYFGTKAELKGCINDVHRMRGLITSLYGFPQSPDAMLILTDDQSNPQLKPTRYNILSALRWLVGGVRPGDALFFHFSGHGAQQEDPSYSEEDGYDETICPADFQSAGMVVDDEIFDILVAPLPSGAKLTAVMDCCHSGTGLDLPFTWHRGNWTEEDNPCHSAGDVLLISGCQDEQCSSDGGGGYGRPMGAMTTALCNTLERSRGLNHMDLLDQLRRELGRGGFEQVPSLTASQRFNTMKPFSPIDGMEGNQNPSLGRHFRKKKHAKRPALLQGGLGEMLAAGAVGFMVSDMLMGGDMASGLVMGGAGMLMGGGGMMMDGAAGMMDGAAGMMDDRGGLLDGFFGGGDEGGGFFD